MLIIHIITGLGDGGAEAVLYRLSTSDKENCHKVISLMNGGKYGVLLKEAGVEVECLNMPAGSLTPGGLKLLWQLLRNEKKVHAGTDMAVQTWMYHGDLVGGLVARTSGIKNIVWGIHHSILEKGKTKASTRWIAKINAMLSHWIPEVIVCCAEKSRLIHEEIGFSSRKMKVIPNGYDLQKFSPNPAGAKLLRQEWGIPENMPLLGMVSRFDPQKDHDNLIKALALLRSQGLEFRCVLVGSGMDAANQEITSKLLLNGLQEHVHLLGQRSDIPAVMSALDLHVLSSSAEAFPNVIAEAMACETPCVTTDVGDAALMVGDTGWVVPPGNPQALAAGIQDAVSAMAQAEAWLLRQAAARAHVSNSFGLDRMLASYRDAWEGRV
ncbi:glycosyltransferase [Comamonas sp. NyZ500]|uniref:glycosyltransferase family 4 protein n=1 Tax=Comamonas TaxID=283 RepID=UPI00057B331D|nr:MULTISPECIES: glycosyltransferase [Comamonas]MBL5976844.1 glycosyltransferase [Comamonas sp. NyZ500]